MCTIPRWWGWAINIWTFIQLFLNLCTYVIVEAFDNTGYAVLVNMHKENTIYIYLRVELYQQILCSTCLLKKLTPRFWDVTWPACMVCMVSGPKWLWFLVVTLLKVTVVVAKPNANFDLNNCVRNKVSAIPVSTIRMAHFSKILKTCVEIEVGHRSDFNLKKWTCFGCW